MCFKQKLNSIDSKAMDLDFFLPRRRNYWDALDWPQSRPYLGWSDPFEEVLLPTLALAFPQKGVQRRGASEVANDPNKFEVKLDCSHFKPEEIEVKTVDKNVIIHGKHEEKMDKHGWVTREFTRRYTLPDDCEANQIKSSLTPNGVLSIEAPKKRLEPLNDNERVVPINVIHESSNDTHNQIQN